MFSWLNELINKWTTQFHTVLGPVLGSYVADPATFRDSNQCSGDFISLWDQINISEFVLLLHYYCKYQNSEFEFLLQNDTVLLFKGGREK